MKFVPQLSNVETEDTDRWLEVMAHLRRKMLGPA